MPRQRALFVVDRDELATVFGGRGVSQSKEMDPQMLQAMQALVKAVSSIGDARKAAQKQNQQQLMSFAMHSMDSGGGGGGGGGGAPHKGGGKKA